MLVSSENYDCLFRDFATAFLLRDRCDPGSHNVESLTKEIKDESTGFIEDSKNSEVLLPCMHGHETECILPLSDITAMLVNLDEVPMGESHHLAILANE